MSKTKDYLEYLTTETGISPAGSQEELDYAQTISKIFTAHGLTPQMQDISAASLGSVLCGLTMIALFVGILLAGMGNLVLVVLGVLLVVAGTWLLAAQRSGKELITKIGPRVQSQNVIGVRRAEGDEESLERPVVIIAHYDTPHIDILSQPVLAPVKKYLAQFSLYTVAAVAVCAVLQILLFLPEGFRRVFWVIGIIAALPTLVWGAVCIIDRFMPYADGAVDNKSSLAAMMGVLESVSPAAVSPVPEYASQSNLRPFDEPVDAHSTTVVVPRSAQMPVQPAASMTSTTSTAAQATSASSYQEPAMQRQVEKVVGTRHGEQVLRTLGIVPPTCEITYIDPEVRMVPAPPQSRTSSMPEAPNSDEKTQPVPASKSVIPAQTTEPTQAVSPSEPTRCTAPDQEVQTSAPAQEARAFVPTQNERTTTSVSNDDIVAATVEDKPSPAPTAHEHTAGVTPASNDAPSDVLSTQNDAPSQPASASSDAADTSIMDKIDTISASDTTELPVSSSHIRTDTPSDTAAHTVTQSHATETANQSHDENSSLQEPKHPTLEERTEQVQTYAKHAWSRVKTLAEHVRQSVSHTAEPDAQAADEPSGDEPDGFETMVPDTPQPEDARRVSQSAPHAIADPTWGHSTFVPQQTPAVPSPVSSSHVQENLQVDAQSTAPFEGVSTSGSTQRMSIAYSPSSDEASSVHHVRTRPRTASTQTENPFTSDVSSVARRASLFDLPDPFSTSNDAFATPSPVTSTPPSSVPSTTTVPNPAPVPVSATTPTSPVPVTTQTSEHAKRTRQAPAPASGAVSPVRLDTQTRASTSTERVHQSASDTITVRSSQSAQHQNGAHQDHHRAGLFVRKQHVESSMSEWLGVDDDFNAKESGENIGSWKNFSHDEGDSDTPSTSDTNQPWKGGATRSAELRERDAASGETSDTASDAAGQNSSDLELRDAILSMGDDSLRNHDVWFIASGASNLDHAGMKQFVEEHRRDLRGAFVVNLESVGAGELTLLTREGYGVVRRGDRRCSSLLSAIAEDLHMCLNKEDRIWANTDATPIMRKSLRAVTLMGLNTADLPACAKTTEDTTSHVDADQVDSVAALITEMIRRS